MDCSETWYNVSVRDTRLTISKWNCDDCQEPTTEPGLCDHCQRCPAGADCAEQDCAASWPLPKRGMRFLHARQITRTSSAANPVPEECEVTAVRQGSVYFRNSTGFRSYVSAESFPSIVKEVLSP